MPNGRHKCVAVQGCPFGPRYFFLFFPTKDGLRSSGAGLANRQQVSLNRRRLADTFLHRFVGVSGTFALLLTLAATAHCRPSAVKAS